MQCLSPQKRSFLLQKDNYCIATVVVLQCNKGFVALQK